jgi:hypothetical protein
MDYTKTKEYRDFLKTKRQESKRNQNLFPYVNVHTKALTHLRKLLNNGCCETFYEYQLAYDDIASRIVNNEVR